MSGLEQGLIGSTYYPSRVQAESEKNWIGKHKQWGYSIEITLSLRKSLSKEMPHGRTKDIVIFV
jgi:hypothetical protein